MKSFPAGFAAEVAKKTGSTPLWILRLVVNGINYDLSDNGFTFAGGAPNAFGAVLPWVGNWGAIRESISGAIGEMLVADLSLSILVDQDAALNIKDLALTYPLEKSRAILFLWFDGLNVATDPPQEMFSGYVKDIAIPDETRVEVMIEDDSTRFQRYVGNRITSEVYPLADPDVVGKTLPIVYGSVEKLPALCVDGGWITSTVADMTATATQFLVSELPTGGGVGRVITIDDEKMLVTQIGGVAPRANRALSSQGSIVTASSIFPGTYPSSMSDGVIGNAWTAAVGHTFPVWVVVNFPAATLIDTVKITFGNGGPVPTFKIHSRETANGANVLQKDVTGNAAAVYSTTFPAVSAREIVIEFNSNGITNGALNVIELETWGDGITYPAKQLTVVRGYGTPAETHSARSTVVENKSTPLVYLLADHPLTSIGDIYSRIRGIDVDITSDCTKYIGSGAFAPGGQLAGYPGKAAITIADFATVSQKISIVLENSLSVAQGSHSHAVAGTVQTVAFDSDASIGTGWNDPLHYGDKARDGNVNTYAKTDNRGGYLELKRAAVVAGTGTPISARLALNLSMSYQTNQFKYYVYIAGVPVVGGFIPQMAKGWLYSPSFPITSWAGMNSTGYLRVVVEFFAGGYAEIYEVNLEVTASAVVPTASAATGVALIGSLGLSGNSVADVMVGSLLMANANRNITTPSAVLGDFLATYCGDATLSQVGTLPASYTLNGAITEYRKAIETIDYLAFQARSYFRKIAGVALMIVRETNPASVGSISACALTSEGIRDIQYKKAAITDVINAATVLYNRDWTSTSKQAESYRGASKSTDAASIEIYGEQERPEMFYFDFVTSPTMAADLAGYYMDFYGDRKWRITFRGFLDAVKFEFGDVVTIPFLNDLVGTLVDVSIQPGSTSKIDSIQFTIETVTVPAPGAFALVTLAGEQFATKAKTGVIYV